MPSAAKGFHLDPRLPMRFDSTPNNKRPASHGNWWGIPYIVTRRDDNGEVLAFNVRRLDGGAWDRSTSLGQAETLEGAVEICQRSADDEMFECNACHATIMARYAGPMTLLEDGEYYTVTMCSVCGFVASKDKQS
jgi:hypothetical protein